jgi:hypothetical protein
MKSNFNIDNKNLITNISISNEMQDDEKEIYSMYVTECAMDDTAFVDTSGMNSSDAKYMCAMSYEKNKTMLTEGSGELTEDQKKLPTGLKVGILKRYEKKGTLTEEGEKQLKSLAEMTEIKAEPTAVFIEKPAPESGNINIDLTEEGLKIDEKLKAENEKEALKNPGLQSPTFSPSNE